MVLSFSEETMLGISKTVALKLEKISQVCLSQGLSVLQLRFIVYIL